MVNLRQRRRTALALAVAAVVTVALVVAIVAVRDRPGGAATRDDAVAGYLDALNRNDADRLRRLSGSEGPALDAGIGHRLDRFGSRDIRLTERDIRDGVAPYHAYATVSGTMTGRDGRPRPYREQLYLRSDDDRWYVDLREPRSPAGNPPLPTAATTS